MISLSNYHSGLYSSRGVVCKEYEVLLVQLDYATKLELTETVAGRVQLASAFNMTSRTSGEPSKLARNFSSICALSSSPLMLPFSSACR